MDCISKESFIESYSDFADEVEDYRRDKKDNWSNVDQRFENFVESCYQSHKDDLTIEEKTEFWKKTIKYYYNRYNGDLEEAFDDVETRFSEEAQDDLEEIFESENLEIKSLISDLFKEDLNNLLDTFLDKINEFGEKAKEKLDEIE